MGHFFQKMKDHSKVKSGNLEEQFPGHRIGPELKELVTGCFSESLWSSNCYTVYLVLSAILSGNSYFVVFVTGSALCFGFLEGVYLPVKFTGH